jgi:hypothetical protein
VLVLAECLTRDNDRTLVPETKIFEWGDRIATWYLRELDVRGHVAGKGWAHAVAHGADAIGALAGSAYFAAPELTVLLDVLADRALLPVDRVFVHGEPDRMAMATMAVLRRNVLPLSVLEPWVMRLAAAAGAAPGAEDAGDRDPFLTTGNPEALLRALYLQLSLDGTAPAVRPDLLLVLVEALRASNPRYLRPR